MPDQGVQRPPLRLALLTLEALANAAAVRRFLSEWHRDIVLVGLSDPFRAQEGGIVGQARRLLGRSGPRLLPFLAANFVLPRLAGLVRRGPGATVETTGLRHLAARHGIPAETLADVNAARFHARLRALDVQAIVTFHFDQILSAATIAVAPRGGLNVHVGRLPEQRGPAPTLHALLESPPRFGVTLHRLVPRIDAGAMLARAEPALPPGIGAIAASAALHCAALPLLAEVLPGFVAGTAAETVLPEAPYRSFPSAAELRRMGGRAGDWNDIARALRTPI